LAGAAREKSLRGALAFRSWQAPISALPGLVLVSAGAVGVRLLVMQTVQQRRQARRHLGCGRRPGPWRSGPHPAADGLDEAASH